MAKRKAELKPTPLSIIGEALITMGIVLMLYVVWQLFINDPIVSARQETQSKTFTQAQQAAPEGLKLENISKKLKPGHVFAKVYIPRFGIGYERLAGQGTQQVVTLNKVGIGHYTTSQWPGAVGNFAVAAHRTSHGAPFNRIDTLRTGDLVFVETNDTWYTYEYRQTAIVDPSAVGVIRKVPQGLKGARSGGKYMTMTSCHPKWSSKQRIVVWLELVDSQPTSQGVPTKLVKLRSK